MSRTNTKSTQVNVNNNSSKALHTEYSREVAVYIGELNVKSGYAVLASDADSQYANGCIHIVCAPRIMHMVCGLMCFVVRYKMISLIFFTFSPLPELG